MCNNPVFDIFREEAREHLGALETLFLDLESAETPDSRRALIDGLFRRAHSLKGDAKVMGLVHLKEPAQQLEDILDNLRESPDTVDSASISQGLKQFDLVRQAFEAWERGETESAAVEEPSEEPVTEPPAAAKRTEDQSSEAQPRMAQAASVPDGETFTVRVPSDRLDRMLNLAGELRISQRSAETVRNRLEVLTEQITEWSWSELSLPSEVAERGKAVFGHWQATLLDQIRRVEGDLSKNRSREELLVAALEADIRNARLLPLVMLTDTLRRAVRDLAQSLGKDIRYEAEAGSILLDKAIIEALKDPLLHLVRNAADHGLETPSERAAVGKPKTGRIRIQAARHGELVRITVEDDGRGIPRDHVRTRLRQSGELNDEEVRQLSDADLCEHLFRPGFTTARASDVSGRGVGLDVVRDTVQRLQGTVSIESTSAAGTTFAITVPVTISTVRILTVLAGGHYYGVPSSAIVRTGRAEPDALCELEGHLVLPLDGTPVRWIRLADLVGTAAGLPMSPEQACFYLLVANQEKQVAVAVDDLEDETEVLLKPLGFPLSPLPGVAGATIRPDGSVQLVLDLVASVWNNTANSPRHPRTETRVAGRILVVDDSPTTRAILRNVFMAAGYAVWCASDGVEALECLRSLTVDLVVSDIEMPRLNGLDLTRRIKSQSRLPVILVSAKEKEEHRLEGLDAGADAYVVKSTFEGDGLLDIVEQFMCGEPA